MRTIAKIAATTISLLAVGLLAAAPASAQAPCGFGSYPPCAEEIVVTPTGIAVTGANIGLWVLIVAGLAIVGVAALLVSRRRTRTA
jgi:LPXTG-motif cell wall-anchored protein